MKKGIKKIFRYIGYLLFRTLWWLEKLCIRNPKIWVFGAWYGQKYSDNSKWLYEYILNNEKNIKAIWITKNIDIYKELYSQGKPVYMSKSIKGALCCLRAKYAFFSSTQLDVNYFFLNGAKQIWLWHGMPLKKILLSEGKPQCKFRNLLNPYERFLPDYTLTSSDFFIPFLVDAFALNEQKIIKTGLPRCDAFVQNKEKEQFILSLRKKFPGAKIFIYLPTFRMKQMNGGECFNPFISDFSFNEIEFVSFLESTNSVFLYKPHYVDADVKVNISSDRFFRLQDSDFSDLYTLLNEIDILVTDYSSVYFDFLASRKPTILLPFDYQNYKMNSRDVYFELYDEVDCKKFTDWHSFLNNKETINFSKKDYLKFAKYLDGFSCKKICDFFLELK